MEQADASPLAEFFASHGREYNPQRAVHSQWRSLQKRFKRDGMSKADKVNASTEYLDAVAQEFGHLFGTSTNDLGSMQSLAQELHINPVPDNLPACTLAVSRVYVNIYDLLDARASGRHDVRVHPTEVALSKYTWATGKRYPKRRATTGNLLAFLLRHIDHPRPETKVAQDLSSKLAEDLASRMSGLALA